MATKESSLSLGDHPEEVVVARLDKIQFPEVCPVCLDEAEDLVPINVYDKQTEKGLEITARSEGDDRVAPLLARGRGATTFWIPTCLLHGTGSVTTTKKKVISIIGFMIFFYPLLFYSLGVITAINYERPLLPVMFPMMAILALIVVFIVYGFFPRALERHLRFIDIDRPAKQFSVHIKNKRYRELLLEENQMHAQTAAEVIKTATDRE